MWLPWWVSSGQYFGQKWWEQRFPLKSQTKTRRNILVLYLWREKQLQCLENIPSLITSIAGQNRCDLDGSKKLPTGVFGRGGPNWTSSPGRASISLISFLQNLVWQFEAQGSSLVFWLVVSTHLKSISQIQPFPQVGLKIKNTTQFFCVQQFGYVMFLKIDIWWVVCIFSKDFREGNCLKDQGFQ